MAAYEIIQGYLMQAGDEAKATLAKSRATAADIS
jgi:hypothetical protein